jgi:hypothetical protein
MLNDINDLSDKGSHFNIVYQEWKWILSDLKSARKFRAYAIYLHLSLPKT